MDRLTQRPLLEWLSWNTRRNGPNSCSSDHLCFEWNEKKKVSVLGIRIVLFSQSLLRSKTYKDTKISNSAPQRGKTHFGGGIIGTWRGPINDTPGFPASLSSELVLIETEKRRHQEFKLFFFFLNDRTNVGEYDFKCVSTVGFLILNSTIVGLAGLLTGSAGHGGLRPCSRTVEDWNVCIQASLAPERESGSAPVLSFSSQAARASRKGWVRAPERDPEVNQRPALHTKGNRSQADPAPSPLPSHQE